MDKILFLYSVDFLQQSKFILNQDIDNLNVCPLRGISCQDCVVDHNSIMSPNCSPERKIKAAKHYIRNEKLKKITNEKQ